MTLGAERTAIGMRGFEGEIAVVTGASRGIGRAIALGLAAGGATVCLVARDRKALEAVAEQARPTGDRLLIHPTDLAAEQAVGSVSAFVHDELGHLDILVHAAGIALTGSTREAPGDELDSLYRVNVRAPYMLTRALLPLLRARRGQVVFVNSRVGLAARAGVGPYASTKHALKAIADSLRDEVNADGVRVLSVYPGRTATPGQAAIHAREKKPYHPERLLQPEDVASVVLHALGLPRTAEVTDISIRPMLKPLSSAGDPAAAS